MNYSKILRQIRLNAFNDNHNNSKRLRTINKLKQKLGVTKDYGINRNCIVLSSD